MCVISKRAGIRLCVLSCEDAGFVTESQQKLVNSPLDTVVTQLDGEGLLRLSQTQAFISPLEGALTESLPALLFIVTWR